jgi:hypothetical protein
MDNVPKFTLIMECPHSTFSEFYFYEKSKYSANVSMFINRPIFALLQLFAILQSDFINVIYN